MPPAPLPVAPEEPLEFEEEFTVPDSDPPPGEEVTVPDSEPLFGVVTVPLSDDPLEFEEVEVVIVLLPLPEPVLKVPVISEAEAVAASDAEMSRAPRIFRLMRFILYK